MSPGGSTLSVHTDKKPPPRWTPTGHVPAAANTAGARRSSCPPSTPSTLWSFWPFSWSFWGPGLGKTREDPCHGHTAAWAQEDQGIMECWTCSRDLLVQRRKQALNGERTRPRLLPPLPSHGQASTS